MANKSKDVKTTPMGINDNFIINGVDFSNIIEKEKFEMKAAQKGVKIEVLSTELTEDMTIKAQDDTAVDFEKRRQQPQNNPKLIEFEKKNKQIEAKRKITNIEEYKSMKENEEQEII